MASGSHLFKIASTIENAPKIARTMENAPASIRFDVLAKAKVEDVRMEKKRIMLEKLQSLTGPEGRIGYTLKKLMRIEKKEHDPVTISDLIRWAFHLKRTGDNKSAIETLNLANIAIKNQSSDGDEGKVYLSRLFRRWEEEEKVGVAETLNEFRSKRFSITKADLLSWAKKLDKEGKHHHALEIFEWMEERKKMSFTTGEVAVFLDLILRTKGYTAADAYFRKLYPNLRHVDWMVRPPVTSSKPKILIGYELPKNEKGTRVVRCIGISGYNPTHFR
ncbi:unnamed protein product [Arabidopsis arenosa]|nr:unnamed protein product [Arabidopsis arenosa]